MANVIEVIIKAIDQASKIIAGVEEKATSSTAAMVKGFEGVGIASGAVDKRLGEYGAAVTNVARVQNQLKQAQLDAVDAASKLAQAQKNLANNTDPTRLSELNRELVDAQVNLDKAGKEAQDLSTKLRTGQTAAENAGGGFSKMQTAIVVANQAMQLAGQITDGLRQIYDSTIGETVKYAAQVKDLSETLSLSAEETSKLISIGEKFGVSTDTLTNSLQMMTKRGMAPTLDGLAKLADKVMAIKDPVERSAMLVDLFGRNWTALFPILEKGGAAIRAAGDEAVRFGKVLNTETVQAAEKLQIETNTLNEAIEGLKIKLTKDLIPDLATSAQNMVILASALDRTAKPLDALNYLLGVNERAFGRQSQQAQYVRNAIAEYTRVVDNATGTLDAVDRAQGRAAASTTAWAHQLQAAQLAPTYDAVEAAIRRTADAAASLQKQIAAGAAQKFILDVGISGRLVNETKQFTQSQTDLQKRLKETADELADLEKKQGAVSKTTVKNQMSAAELNLAQIKLAQTAQALNQAQNQVSTVHQKTAKSAAAAAAAQAKLAKETDPLKQAALSAEIAVQQEHLDSANQSVNTYVDNSKRIAELKQTYDELTAEIDNAAKAHTEANKRILFDYAQQAIAQQNLKDGITGMTAVQVDALNKLAVTWGLKSQADVDAMNQMLLAAKNLASDNSLDEFKAIAQGALEGPKKPSEDLIKLMQGMQKEAGDKMPKVAKSIGDVKKPAKDLFDQMAALEIKTQTSTTRMQTMTQYGVLPMAKAFDILAISLGTVNTLLGQLPGSLPSTNLPMPTPLPATPPPTRTTPLPGGAQRGLTNFVVPPNPRGGSGDYFPIMFAPGERINATPNGRDSAGGVNISGVTINVNDTSATPQQIEAAVYRGIDDVFKAAMRQAR